MNVTNPEEEGNCCAFRAAILDEVLPPILILEFMFGLAGNFLALWMFVFHMDKWKPNAVYLTHLAVADSIVLFCLPFRADYYLREKNWLYGDITCRILMFMLASNRAAGIFFLTAVAVDRYFKIVHPMNRINRLGLNYANCVCVGLWGLILACTGNLLAQPHFSEYGNRTQCESFNICTGADPLYVWHNVFYIVQFSIPTVIIAFCTVRITWQLKNRTQQDRMGKIKRAVHFVLAVALIFVICFFPSTVTCVFVLILKAKYDECEHFRMTSLAFYSTVCLTYFNSVLNPVVYYFSSPAFSGKLEMLLNKILRREGGPNRNVNISTVDS